MTMYILKNDLTSVNLNDWHVCGVSNTRKPFRHVCGVKVWEALLKNKALLINSITKHTSVSSIKCFPNYQENYQIFTAT